MTWKPTQAARDNSNQTNPLSQLILVTIATYCDDNGTMDKAEFTPNYKTIAKRCKCSVSQVKSRIPELVASGDLIHKVDGAGRGTKNRFTINLPMPNFEDMNMEDKFEDLPDVERINNRLDRLEGAMQGIMDTLKEIKNTVNHDNKLNGLNGLGNGLNGLANGLNGLESSPVGQCNNNNNNSKEQASNDASPLSLDNTVQPDVNTSKDDKSVTPSSLDSKNTTNEQPTKINSKSVDKFADAVIPDELNIESFLSLWIDFKNHRSEIKKRMTSRAQKMMLGKFSKAFHKHGIDFVLFEIERSIINGWQDVYLDDNSPYFYKRIKPNQPNNQTDWNAKANTGWV